MSLVNGARIAINTCLGVKKGESVLIITDTEKEKIGQALFEVANEAGAEAIIVKMLPRTRHGEEPPRAIADMMLKANVIIAPTVYSLTHTQARKKANDAGARIATMPGITEDMMRKGGINADFEEVQKSIKKLGRKLKGSKHVKLTTELGADLELSVEKREWLQDTGICQRRGEFINLPAGEIFIAPREGTANGTLIIDGAFWDLLEEPVKVTIKDGYATRFVGAKNTVKALSRQGRKGRNVAELGIGMNPKAKIIGNVLEDEKVKGTVHVAFGDNSTFGGKIKAGVHMDGIIKKPTLIIDDDMIMEQGEMKY